MSTLEEEDAPAAAKPVVAAVSVRGRTVQRTPLGWFPWAALAVAGAIALAMVAIAVVSATTDDRSTPAPPTTAPPTTAAPPAGTLTAPDGTALLPLPPDGLAAVEGQPVEARGVAVQSVVDGTGFWVGTDETNRVFVHPTAPMPVQPGQRIDFDGTVTARPDGGYEVEVTPAAP